MQNSNIDFQDNLFYIIKSLTKAEKGYFKKYVTGFGKVETNYLKLFDTYDNMKEFDESLLQKKFSSTLFMKRPDMTKAYLYELILKSLRSFYAKSSCTQRLNELLMDIELLFSKGLFKLSLKKISQAQHLTLTYELKKYDLLLLEWEKKVLCAELNIKEFKNRYHKINNKEKRTIDDLQNIVNYCYLDSEIFILNRINPARRDKKELKRFEAIFNHPLMKDDKKAHSFQAKTMYYGILVSYFFAAGKIEECYDANYNLIALLNNHPKIKEESVIKFMYTLRNHIAIATRLGYFKDAEHYLQTLKNIKLKTRKEIIKHFEFSMVLELNLLNKLGKYEEGVNLISQIEKKIIENKSLLDAQHRLLFSYLFVIIYFGNNEYKKSLFWINKILNNGILDIRTDIYCFVRIFNLILHFELDNIETMESMIKSTYRFLLKRNKIYQLETIALAMIKRLPTLSTKENFDNLYISIKTELILLYQDSFERTPFEYFDFISYLTSKIENRPFAEIVREKNKLSRT